jgi:exonuclease SbcD
MSPSLLSNPSNRLDLWSNQGMPETSGAEKCSLRYGREMILRILHTSDWHLGHTLHDVSRSYEHEQFLSWLLDTLQTEQIDALLIAGDIFDAANPSAAAQRQWYRFLSQARRQQASLDIVAIAGNHDSAARLEAPRALLEELDIHVVGTLSRNDGGGLDTDRLLHPLRDGQGNVGAWCAAVPFLRPADLPRMGDVEDPTLEGVRAVYGEVLAAAKARRTTTQALVAMGHCYMKSATLSELSERKILGGNEHALPADLFGNDVSYVALGHLHLAQIVAEKQHVRYAGSPLPLSMDEVTYPHQVCVATFDKGQLVDVKTPRIPRAVELLRIPEDGPQPLQEVLKRLSALPAAETTEPKPYLEVRIRLGHPDTTLRRLVSEAIEGKHARLVKLTLEYAGTGKSLAQQVPHQDLAHLTADAVFLQMYQSVYGSEPTEEIMACFHEIVESVQQEECE